MIDTAHRAALMPSKAPAPFTTHKLTLVIWENDEGGFGRCTLGEFFADNADMGGEMRDAIRATLARGETYHDSIDQDWFEVSLAEMRPGERMLLGAPYVFDQDAVNDFEACVAAIDIPPPARFERLSDDEVDGLFYQGVRLSNLSDERDCRLRHAAEAERTRRVTAMLAASVRETAVA